MICRGYRMACRQADKLVAPTQKERISGDNERVDTPLHKGCESRVDVAFAASIQNDHLQSEDASRRLQFFDLVRHTRIYRIHETTDRPQLGNQIAEQFEPFRSQGGDSKVYTRYIAAWPIEAGNKAEFHRV